MRNWSILLVDDDPLLIDALTGMLSVRLPQLGVHSYTSARMALTHLQKHTVSAVVTDLKMPELDGFALLRAAKNLQPDVPILLCSGEMEAATERQAFSLGAYQVLKKPFERKQFLAAVTSAYPSRVCRETFFQHFTVDLEPSSKTEGVRYDVKDVRDGHPYSHLDSPYPKASTRIISYHKAKQ